MSYTLICLCCGEVKEFKDSQAAFDAGWDDPDHFPSGPTCCDLCPAAPIVIHGLAKAQARHAEAHARWKRDGRPEKFETEKELALDGIDPGDFHTFIQKLGVKE